MTVSGITTPVGQPDSPLAHSRPNAVNRTPDDQLMGKFGSSPGANPAPTAVPPEPEPLTGVWNPAMGATTSRLDVTA